MTFAMTSRPCPTRTRVPVAALTTFGMGGEVPLLLEPRNRDELVAAIRALRDEGIPFRILGGGANVLIDDRGLDAAVVSTGKFAFIQREGDDTRLLRLAAGLPIPTFVVRMREMGHAGAECLVGIPGTMGGATVMNAGGRHGWLSSIVRRVRVLLADGTETEMEPDPTTFGYRSSVFGDDRIVLETVVAVEPGDRAAIRDRGREILKEKSAAQPLTQKSAGCVFKNPRGRSAGKMLEEAGVKGLRIGGAMVSDKHANFIVNLGGATLRDVNALIHEARRRVFERFGVELEREVKVWERESGSGSAAC